MRLLPLLGIVVALAAPASAQAEVRSGHVDDPIDAQGPSLNHNDDITFVSAAYDTDIRAAFNVGAQKYITKPADPDVLLQAVRELIEPRRGSRV